MFRFSDDGSVSDLPGHSVPLAGLGGFILLFGFLAFNGGSQASISQPGDGAVVALAIVNTVLGASTGGVAVLCTHKIVTTVNYNEVLFNLAQPDYWQVQKQSAWSFVLTLNGALAGMVALCAGCNLYEPWAALVVGAGGGLGFMAIHHLMLALR